MTLNGVIAQTPCSFTEFIDFGKDYVKVVEDTPILFAAEM